MSSPLYDERFSLPPEICAAEENSFARYTLQHRFPHIIEQIVSDNDYEPGVINNSPDSFAEE
ncbi:MAG: hypothetical protein F6K19_48440 [Cyanothece sp. SIO1E1]|nr:hypothetical protein [Cyanothece sp. SIO1E1]